MRQVVYYKMQQIYNKLRQLLQNAAVITKCVVYYKMRRHNDFRTSGKTDSSTPKKVLENTTEDYVATNIYQLSLQYRDMLEM